MSDHILRAITSDGLVQAAAISSRDLTERARQIHKTLPVATAALGRTLAGASMMGNALKGHGASLTPPDQGQRPLGTILAVSDSDGNVRGYVTNPQTELPLRPRRKAGRGWGRGTGGLPDGHQGPAYEGALCGYREPAGRRDRRGHRRLLRGVRADPHRLRSGGAH